MAMVSDLLQYIISTEPFTEAVVINAVRDNPELLNENNWQEMNEFLSHKTGSSKERTLDIFDFISQESKRGSKYSKLYNELKDNCLKMKAEADESGVKDRPLTLKNLLSALKIAVAIKNLKLIEALCIDLLQLLPELEANLAKAVLYGICDCAFGLNTLQNDRINSLNLQLYKAILRRFAVLKTFEAEQIILLMQHAKGFGYGASISQTTELPSPFSYGVAILQEIELAKQSRSKIGKATEIKLNEDLLLASYLSGNEKTSTGGSASLIANLEINFDRWLNNYLLQNATEGSCPPLYLDDILSKLSEKAVLYIQFMGSDATGSATQYVLLISKESIAISLATNKALFAGDLELTSNEIVYTSSLLSTTVAETRKSINEDPDDELPCSQQALDQLKFDADMLVNPIIENLNRLLKLGKTDLIIQAHTAFHYYPFHLLPFNDGLLADYFTVTALPNLSMLQTNINSNSEKSQEIASFGLSYTNSKVCPRLKNAINEADNIAKLFDYQAQTDETGTATTSNFIAAFSLAKRIHLSGHGLMNTAAPAFQKLFLIDAKGNDQCLEAWELMDLEARNVDLLTLSACQTALGRFDFLDNLHGLPAMFLKAGVKTIIGALWEAETNSCETFFVSLYGFIKEGKSKKDAFRLAQSLTRSKHPEYRDWACFFYLGI